MKKLQINFYKTLQDYYCENLENYDHVTFVQYNDIIRFFRFFSDSENCSRYEDMLEKFDIIIPYTKHEAHEPYSIGVIGRDIYSINTRRLTKPYSGKRKLDPEDGSLVFTIQHAIYTKEGDQGEPARYTGYILRSIMENVIIDNELHPVWIRSEEVHESLI